MTFDQAIVASVFGIVGAVVTTLLGAWVSRRFGLPGIARQVDDQEEKLIERLQARLDLAESDARTAKTKADETERRRQACEEEIGRLKRDLRMTERELLELYRKTGEVAPGSLVKRHRDHQSEAET